MVSCGNRRPEFPGCVSRMSRRQRELHKNTVSMAFHITHRYGEMESPVSIDVFPSLLAELDDRSEDTEHCSVAVTHDSEWCIEASMDGYVTFESLESGEPRHMKGLPPEAIIDLWTRLAKGDIDSLANEPWKPGY